MVILGESYLEQRIKCLFGEDKEYFMLSERYSLLIVDGYVITPVADNTIKKVKVKTKKIIAIDPGHGDHNDSNSKIDPGSTNGDDLEKDIVLEISNVITEKLMKEGYEVIQTRKGDVEKAGKKLSWRLEKAKQADLLVSIHNNANSSTSPCGFEVFYKKNHAESKSLADSIQRQNLLFLNRGIKPGDELFLLKGFKKTAVLVEAGFISNPDDLKLLKSKTSVIGEQIAEGIITHLKNK